MTPDDVRAAAESLVLFHDRFAPLFGKDQAQDQQNPAEPRVLAHD